MDYILDTNTCIYIIKKKPVSVLERFNNIPLGQIGISVITLAELEYGARKSAIPEKNLAALHQFLIPIGPLDTLIAAHAKSMNCILVTNNEKEFRRVGGLQVENWV